MKFQSNILLAAIMLAVLGCAPSITVKQDYDKEANFAALKTFAWLPMPVDPAAGVKSAMERNSLLDKRIKQSVDAQLAAKGYQVDVNNPDFVVTYHTGAEDKVNVTDWGYGYGRYGAWHGGGVDVYQYTEGTLILDVIDWKSKQLVWRGFAQGTIDPDAPSEKREQKLNEAVTRMLANFPPTGK
jgi:hypothetical protein